MRGKLILFILAAATGHAASAGDIRRCVSPNGDVMFTNLACPADTRAEHVSSYEPVPDSEPERIDPAAVAAAASARQARAAAEEAWAAAEAARYAYEDAAARMQNDQAYDNGYQDVWYPYYTGYGGNFRKHGHGHGHGRGPHPEPHGGGGGRTMGGGIAIQQPGNLVGGRTIGGPGGVVAPPIPSMFSRQR